MKHTIYFFALSLFSLGAIAQSGVTIGSSNPPDPSAVLDLQSTQQGFLIPRLTTTQRNAIVSPANGLMIFNTTTTCLQAYLPQTGWRDVTCQCNVFPSSAFTSPPLVTTNNAAQFSATQGGLTYSWTFQSGSPATSTSQTPSVTWSQSGTYTVSLTVTDLNGCSSTTSNSVTVTNCPPPGGSTVTFNYTGSAQQWTVPACATSIVMDVRGAAGATSVQQGGNGGLGGRVQGTMTVTPGSILYIYVGGAGTYNGVSAQAPGGYNGGGNVPAGNPQAGSGGGASDIRVGGQALNNRVIVAGGGGGGLCQPGGAGGGLTAGNAGAPGCGGQSNAGGKGGTQAAGGLGGVYGCCGCLDGLPGTLGIGGDGLLGGVCNGSWTSGSGGGGYYGGGSGTTANAGGGGSSYTNGSVTGVTHTQGTQAGNGQIIITY